MRFLHIRKWLEPEKADEIACAWYRAEGYKWSSSDVAPRILLGKKVERSMVMALRAFGVDEGAIMLEFDAPPVEDDLVFLVEDADTEFWDDTEYNVQKFFCDDRSDKGLADHYATKAWNLIHDGNRLLIRSEVFDDKRAVKEVRSTVRRTIDTLLGELTRAER